MSRVRNYKAKDYLKAKRIWFHCMDFPDWCFLSNLIHLVHISQFGVDLILLVKVKAGSFEIFVLFVKQHFKSLILFFTSEPQLPYIIQRRDNNDQYCSIFGYLTSQS